MIMSGKIKPKVISIFLASFPSPCSLCFFIRGVLILHHGREDNLVELLKRRIRISMMLHGTEKYQTK